MNRIHIVDRDTGFESDWDEPLCSAADAYEAKAREDREIELAFGLLWIGIGTIALLLVYLGTCVGSLIDWL